MKVIDCLSESYFMYHIKLFSGVYIIVKADICCLLGGDIHPSPPGGSREGAPKGILDQHQAMGVVPGPGMHQPSLHQNKECLRLYPRNSVGSGAPPRMWLIPRSNWVRSKALGKGSVSGAS